MRSAKFLLTLGISLLCACAANTDDSSNPDGDQPTESTEGAWDAESVDHEADSTHLWIVDRGIDILAKHADDAAAQRIVDIVKDPTCQAQWHQGLLDADFKAAYNQGETDLPLKASDIQVAMSKATWESHFYDPDTGQNYKGTPKTAYTEAVGHLKNALENHLEDKKQTACYELGLALHYYTDLTQPMHATNFTALSRPAKLHSNLEGYSMEIQERYPLRDWTGKPTGTVDEYIMQTARDAKPLFMEGVQAIIQAYKSYTGWHTLTCRNIDAEPWRFIERQHLDYRHCWEGNPGVDAIVGKSLISAQDHTAKYIYLVAQQLESETTGQSAQ